MARALFRGGLVELGILLLAAFFALTFHLRLAGQGVEDADYQEVASVLSSEAAPGDGVLLFPWWTERARVHLPSGLPVVGYLGSDRDPLTLHPRVWLLSVPGLPGAQGQEFQEAFLPGRASLGPTRSFGNLQLTLYRNDRHRPSLFSATREFASARVYLEGPGGRMDCPFNGREHHCPGGGGLRVAPEWHELEFLPRRCLWMHPPGGQNRLVAEFSSVPLGSRLRLEGGTIWEHAVQASPELTITRVGVDNASGAPLQELSIPPGLEGMQKSDLPTGAMPSPLGLKLWVESANPALRETCVELSSLGPSAAEGP